jgi:hypothetical protein
MRLLKVNDDLTLEVVPETMLVPEFKALMKKSKSPETIHKELAYIYHMANHDGPYASYPLNERHLRLANDLFNDHTWRPNDVIEKAVEKYKELNHSPSTKALTTIINAMYKTNKIVDTLIDEIEKNLEEGQHKSGINNKRGQVVSGIELMLNDLTALMKASKEVPHLIDQYEKLQDKLLKEKMEAASRYRGGVEINDFER